MIQQEARARAHAECSSFAPYRVLDAHLDGDRLRALVAESKRALSLSGYDDYRRLLAGLARLDRCDVRPMRELFDELATGRSAVALRHDMDLDPFTSVEIARALAGEGLPGTFYVHHTAPYYGELVDGELRRNRDVLDVVRTIQGHGCEIGLHNDALWLYQQYGIEGAEAVTTELRWLRSAGIDVRGTAAHNSAPVYGAENFEIFQGRAVFDRFVLERNEQRIPLQTLSEAELGLTYEANHPDSKGARRGAELARYLSFAPADAVRNASWMRTYLLENPYTRWGADYNAWLLGDDQWTIAGHADRDSLFVWDARLDDVLRFLTEAPLGSRIVLHVHPVYILGPGEPQSVPRRSDVHGQLLAGQEQVLRLKGYLEGLAAKVGSVEAKVGSVEARVGSVDARVEATAGALGARLDASVAAQRQLDAESEARLVDRVDAVRADLDQGLLRSGGELQALRNEVAALREVSGRLDERVLRLTVSLSIIGDHRLLTLRHLLSLWTLLLAPFVAVARRLKRWLDEGSGVRLKKAARLARRLPGIAKDALGAARLEYKPTASGRRILMLTISQIDIDPRINKVARALAGAGYDVDILCHPPIWSDPAREDKVQPGVTYVRVPQDPASRVADLFYQDVFVRAGTGRLYDFVHVNDLMTLLTGWVLARRKGVPLVYDAHEMWTENVAYNGSEWVPMPLLARRLARWFEGFLLRDVGLLTTVSPSIASEFARRYRLKRPPRLLPNYPERSLAREGSNGAASIRELCGLGDDRFVTLYLGGVNPLRNIENVIRAHADLPDSHVFVIRGPGVEHYGPDYLALAESLRLQGRVFCLPPVPMADVVEGAAGADCGILMLRNICRNFYWSYPNKLFEYMLAGLPVAVSDFPDTGGHVQRERCGIVFDPESPDSIAKALRWLAENPEEARAMGRRGREAVLREHHWEQAVPTLVEGYQSLQSH